MCSCLLNVVCKAFARDISPNRFLTSCMSPVLSPTSIFASWKSITACGVSVDESTNPSA